LYDVLVSSWGLFKGCAALSGELNLDMGNSRVSDGDEITVLHFTCINGSFSAVNLLNENADDCSSTVATQKYENGRMYVLLSVSKGDCSNNVEKSGAMSVVSVVLIVVGVLAFIAVVGILILSVPKLRKKVFPFRRSS